jgi:uncharacterized protein (DUF1778 family)
MYPYRTLSTACIFGNPVAKWHQDYQGKGDPMASDTAALVKERITARVPKDVRERIEEAADRSGATLNQFLVQAAIEKADRVLEREKVMRLSARDAEWLLSVLDQPPRTPNAKLQRALDNYEKATRGDPNRAFDWPAQPDDV